MPSPNSKHRRRSRILSPGSAAASTPSFETPRHSRRHWRLLLVCGLVLAAYSNSFHGAPVFDSATVIRNDPRIREFTCENLASIMGGGYWYGIPSSGLYRPLTTFSYLLNNTMFGGEEESYHWTNFALHEVNIVLVYALGVLILGEAWPALALAAIWGLHPLLTESVTNIVGRADLLAGLGVLAGLLCYMRSIASRRRGLAWVLGLVAAQTVAIFSKENGAILICLMVLYDLIWPASLTWRRRALTYGATALPLLIFFFLRSSIGMHMQIDFADNPLVSAGFWAARLTAIHVIAKYLWLFLWPAHLSADYSYNAIPIREYTKGLMSLLLLSGAAIAILLPALRCRMGKSTLFFPGFFFVALLPVSNLIVLIGSIMAERFLYLPALGLAGLVVAAVCALSRVRPIPAPVALAGLSLVCVVFSARTYARNSDWQDGLSLWSSAVRVSPGSAKAHYNLAKELERIPGRLPEAIAQYREAIRIEPNRADARDNLANALSGTADGLPEAIDEYREALRIAPGVAAVHNDLANALRRMPGGEVEAVAEYRAALRIEPRNPEIHYNLANAIAGMPGQMGEAVEEYRAAIAIEPRHADAHNNLGNALAAMPGHLNEAIAEYKAALRIQPDMLAAHIDLGNALYGIPGELSEAIAEYRAALRIQPDSPEAHNNLGNALAETPGGLQDAIREFESALRSRPDFVDAHISLGKALSLTPGRRPEAITEYENALRLRPDPELRRTVERLRTELR